MRNQLLARALNQRRIQFFSTNRIVRLNAQKRAQKALREYLHGTRNLCFADAEHMSKNSPVFLKKLLAKVENEEDVGRSLTSYFQFHPINEFEPFFESLGLKPLELHSLLPRALTFLSDDGVLVENYHVLCNYGVPRSKMGEIYKEAAKVFRYDFGVLSSKLKVYEKLGLCKPAIIKLITCCPTFLFCDSNVEFITVLEKFKALGIDLDCIKGSFSDMREYSWSRILEMLNFLEAMGCEKKDLTSLVKKNPRFVFDKSGKKIYMLVATLLKWGVKMDKVLVLFVQYPQILSENFARNLTTSVNFLFEIGMESEDVGIIVCTHTQVLGSCTCKGSKYVQKKFNLTAEELCKIIKKDPDQLTRLVAKGNITLEDTPKVEGMFLREKTDFLLKIGFVENSDDMTKALRKFGRGDKLQERLNVLVNSGLDDHTVIEMVKLVPSILSQSKVALKKKIDFLVNHSGYPLEEVVAFPAYLCYNSEKIKLRLTMYKWIKEHGVYVGSRSKVLAKSTAALSTLVAFSDAKFERYVVSLHPDGPGVWKTLKNEYPQAKGN